MEILFAFLAGMFVGAGIFIGFGYIQVEKIRKTKAGLMDQIKSKAKDLDLKRGSINERLIKASEIAQAQMSIRDQLDQPSKNALHSKHKNGLIGQLQEMEQDKLDVLRTILAEGYNPLITVLNEAGVKTEIPLSAYVDEASGILGESLGTPPPSTDPDQPRKAGKFMVYKGGKDDGKSH